MCLLRGRVVYVRFRSLAPVVPGFRDLEGESLKNPLTAESYVSLRFCLPFLPLEVGPWNTQWRGDTGKMERWGNWTKVQPFGRRWAKNIPYLWRQMAALKGGASSSFLLFPPYFKLWLSNFPIGTGKLRGSPQVLRTNRSGATEGRDRNPAQGLTGTDMDPFKASFWTSQSIQKVRKKWA